MSASQTVLDVRGLRRSFGGVIALDGVDLVLGRGSRTGLIGPNGAGKTTLFDILSGLVRPDAGRVVLAGRDVTRARPDVRAAAGLARSFQDARLFPSMTVDEAVLVAATPRRPAVGHVAGILGLPHARRSERAARRTVDRVLESTGLAAYRDVLVGELSTGLRRIVDLAGILAREPVVVLLDEPSAGLAQPEVEQLAPLLGRVAEETGAAVVVIEHDVPLVADFADVLLVLECGRVIARGTPAEVLRDPLVVAAYLGSDGRTIAGGNRRS